MKQLINWKLRYSLLGTLAMKHKSSIKQCINKYSVSPGVICGDEKSGVVVVKFPTKECINNKKKVFNDSSISPIVFKKIIRIKASTLNVIKTQNFKCAVVSCKNEAKQIYNIRKLGYRLHGSVSSFFGSRVLQN